MIYSKDIEEFNIRVNAEIYRLETMRKELELQLSELLILNKSLVDTEEFFSEIDEQLRDLRDIKLEANVRYNQQFIGNDLTSIKNYIKSKKARV